MEKANSFNIASSNNNEKFVKMINPRNTLRNKEFLERNSLLDDLMENKHIVAVYRLFLALFLGSAIHLVVQEYCHRGVINFGQRLIVAGTVNFHRFAVVWACLFLSNCLVYYGFRYWSTLRINVFTNAKKIKVWDWFWLVIFIVYLLCWLWFSTWIVLKLDMEILLVIVMTCEITRMLMKSYAFVRSNAPRVLKFKPHTENDILTPTFTQFIYFLWIPTLIYRDSYPRTKYIRWGKVVIKAIEFSAGVLFMSTTMELYVIEAFRDYGIKPYSRADLTIIFLQNAACGVIITMTGFYMVLHAWMSAFAEICRFGDRLFYQDWWTASNFETFYRTWNGVIHDWLFTYVYKDFYEIVSPGNKAVSKLVTFFLSALFHEYILYTSFGFVLPVVFLQFFVFSTIFTFIKFKPDAFGNVLILYGMGLGNGVSYTAFGLEYFARLNCPIENPTLSSYLIPRFFSCGIN